VKVARPVREGGPGKRVSSNADTAPGTDPHWDADHGETSEANSALLCERHHTKAHHGFRVERQPDGTWHTYRPDGTQILIHPPLRI
jgi:hypothetical protein